jgi:hypothetical protein
MRLRRQPELIWLLFFAVAGLVNLADLPLSDWGSLLVVALGPGAVMVAVLAGIAQPSPLASSWLPLARAALSSFLAVTAGTLLLTQLPSTGRAFRPEGGAFLWALIVFVHCSLLGWLSLLAWLVIRGAWTLRRAVQLTAGAFLAIAGIAVLYPVMFTVARDPIEWLEGAERVRALSAAYGDRGRTPRAAWQNDVEVWDAFSVAFAAPDRLVVRVVTDYPAALAARPPLPGGLATPRAVMDPARTVAFWNRRFDGFEMLRSVGIASPMWRASWEPPTPGAPPTLVWVNDSEAAQMERSEFLALGEEAERLATGLFDRPSAWGYWAEIVESWLADPAFAKRSAARDVRRARISLLQVAADCASGSAGCSDAVPRLTGLAETAALVEGAPLPPVEEIRARLTGPLYDLAGPSGPAAFRDYLRWVYDAVETTAVFERPR